MNKKYIYYFLFAAILTDVTYSFLQHYSMPLDGDMAGGIVPSDDVKRILKDPFGISVITENAIYPNPNRYFAHWAFYTFFNNAPQLIQNFVTPIDSVYISAAIAKTCIQLLIIVLLALYIIGRKNLFNSDFLIATTLLVPLFQTNGYKSYMGIIDPSITYTFFYALPCALLLLFYLPFFFDSYYGMTLMKKPILKTFVFILAIIVVFNGALNPGIILTITILLIANAFFKTDTNLLLYKRVFQIFTNVPKTILFCTVFVSLLSLYAIYIGTNNSIFLGETISLAERYSRIPKGLMNIVTQKMAIPIFLLIISINIYLLRRNIVNEEINRSLRLFSWIGLFSLLYIIFLPLGGYKDYRPYILRYDTIMPITIGLIFIYAKSSFQLLKLFEGKRKNSYILLIALTTIIFSYADKPEFNKNKCEEIALEKISKSNTKIVYIENDCTILSWTKILDSEKSTLNGQLLQIWNIANESKQYYQNK